jgi:hypothetical protein
MRGFDELRAKAIDGARQAAAARGLPPEQIADLLEGASLPGLLASIGYGGALQANGAAPTTSVDEFLRTVATNTSLDPAAVGSGIAAGDVQSLLADALAGGRGGSGTSDDTVRRVLWPLAMRALERETGVTLDDEQREQAIALLTSGRLFADAAQSVATVLHLVPGLPLALVRDVGTSPFRLVQLSVAAASDLAGTPASAVAIVADLLADGDLDQHPALMVRTLGVLFRFASVASVAATLADLVRPENKSVRLALVAYARANGIPLREADLDLLRSSLLQTSHPDLGPLLAAAVQRMVDERGGAYLHKVLSRIQAPASDAH